MLSCTCTICFTCITLCCQVRFHCPLWCHVLVLFVLLVLLSAVSNLDWKVEFPMFWGLCRDPGHGWPWASIPTGTFMKSWNMLDILSGLGPRAPLCQQSAVGNGWPHSLTRATRALKGPLRPQDLHYADFKTYFFLSPSPLNPSPPTSRCSSKRRTICPKSDLVRFEHYS